VHKDQQGEVGAVLIEHEEVEDAGQAHCNLAGSSLVAVGRAEVDRQDDNRGQPGFVAVAEEFSQVLHVVAAEQKFLAEGSKDPHDDHQDQKVYEIAADILDGAQVDLPEIDLQERLDTDVDDDVDQDCVEQRFNKSRFTELFSQPEAAPVPAAAPENQQRNAQSEKIAKVSIGHREHGRQRHDDNHDVGFGQVRVDFFFHVFESSSCHGRTSRDADKCWHHRSFVIRLLHDPLLGALNFSQGFARQSHVVCGVA